MRSYRKIHIALQFNVQRVPHLQSFFLGRNQFSQYLLVNPDLRERAIVDRFYHSFKNTPYCNRRLIVQAVQYSEIQRYSRLFKSGTLTLTKINDSTRKAINCVTTAPISFIPTTVPTYSTGSLSFFRDDTSLIDQFLAFERTHTNGRFCCKLFKGGDIGLIYDIRYHWRAVYKKELQRVKCALVFTYSHLTLNNTGDGWEVRLPGNHTLDPAEEIRLREFALTYQNLYDDVLANKSIAGTACKEELGHDSEEEQHDEEHESATAATADSIINGVGDWQDE